MRVVIVGNAGAGKTWLGRRLAERFGAPLVHLDDLFWMIGGSRSAPTEEQKAELGRMVRETKSAPSWIVEGAMTNLARLFLDRTDLLVWLDFDWETCRQRILERRAELERLNQPILGSTDWVIQFAKEYYERTTPLSFSGHLELFETFQGKKRRLRSTEDVDPFVREIER